MLRITGKPTTQNQKINKIYNSKLYIWTIIITVISQEFQILVNK